MALNYSEFSGSLAILLGAPVQGESKPLLLIYSIALLYNMSNSDVMFSINTQNFFIPI